MSTAVAVNDSATGKTPLNKVIALALMIFGVVEAVAAYFLVIGPLYVKPVFNQAALYNEQGVTCKVKLFGKLFASDAEIAENQIILSLSDTVLNIVLIYLLMTGILLVLAFCFYKGFAFTKTYFIAVFGAKTVISLVPMLIPFANMRNTMRIFGVVDAVISAALCVYFVYLNSLEYADDMLLTDEQIAEMKKRGIFGGIMFALTAVIMVAESFTMSGYGGNWSIYLGWLKDTSLAQGAAIAILLGIGAIAAITYVREADWAMFYFFSLGTALFASNAIAIVNRVLWVVRTYIPYKNLRAQGDVAAEEWFAAGNGMTMGWAIDTVFLAIAFVASAVLAFMAFRKIGKKLSLKFAADDKKPALALMIGAGSVLLSFILTVAGNTMYDKMLYAGGFSLGAMDYLYFAIYGGVTLFLVTAMLGGYSFTKFGALGLYLVVASTNFENIFNAFSGRSAYVANNPGLVGYNYIIAAVLYILAIVACLAIIVLFVVKEVSNYMYQKRYS